jgi:hypothetical protein
VAHNSYPQVYSRPVRGPTKTPVLRALANAAAHCLSFTVPSFLTQSRYAALHDRNCALAPPMTTRHIPAPMIRDRIMVALRVVWTRLSSSVGSIPAIGRTFWTVFCPCGRPGGAGSYRVGTVESASGRLTTGPRIGGTSAPGSERTTKHVRSHVGNRGKSGLCADVPNST